MLEENPVPYVIYENKEVLVCVKGAKGPNKDGIVVENVVLARFHDDHEQRARGVALFLLDIKHSDPTINVEAVVEYLRAIGIGGDDG